VAPNNCVVVGVASLLNSRDQSHFTSPTVDGDLPGVADFVCCPGDACWIGHARHRSIVGSADLALIVQRPGGFFVCRAVRTVYAPLYSAQSLEVFYANRAVLTGEGQ
jgi:hypothetical protein